MKFLTVTSVSTETVTDMGYKPSWFPYANTVTSPMPPQGEWRVLPDNTGYTEEKSPKVKRGKSWKDVKASGDIKMTPYFHRTFEEKHSVYEVSRFTDNFLHSPFMRDGCYYPDDNKVIPPLQRARSRWTQTYSSVDFKDLPIVGITDLSDQLDSLRNEVLSDVVSGQFSGFDVLTELKEFPETLEFILSVLRDVRHPLKGMKNLIDEYKKASRRTNVPLGYGAVLTPLDKHFMDRWMQYRYAVMPLVYSIRDAVELIANLMDKFKTDRSKRVLPITTAVERPSQDHVFHKIEGIAIVRAVGKSRYDSPAHRLSDLLNINPLLTAWEAIPYSFVVDWFLNVGSWLLAQTGSLRDNASQRSFCVSTKLDYTESRYASFSLTNGGTFKRKYFHDAGCGNTYQQDDDVSTLETSLHEFCFYQKRIKSYERGIVHPTDVKLDLAFDMNWKRWVDTFVLGTNSISTQLRKLRN